MSKIIIPRTAPFATFMAFTGINELNHFLGDKGIVSFSPSLHLYLYPIRILIVSLLLVAFWKEYNEIRVRDILHSRDTTLSLTVGIIVFFLWINMPWTVGASDTAAGYNPAAVSENFTQNSLIGIRLLGASVVVPIMEELFWRSFVMRYIINPDFSKVSLGKFSWGSLLIGNVLFGLEHHYLTAGIMAGVAYSILLYRSRSLLQCIMAHGVTNLILGIYVLKTGQWQFW